MTVKLILDKMLHFNDTFSLNRKIFIAVGSIAAGIFAFNVYKSYKKEARRQKYSSVGKNVVVLHGVPRAKGCISNSPFVIRVETYLRITNIKYEFDDVDFIGPKGKTPWITFNGKEIADSELILDFLNKELSINLDDHLSESQKAISRFITVMLCQHTYWALLYWWWCSAYNKSDDPESMMKMPIYYRIFLPLIHRQVGKTIYEQGIGRHSLREVEVMMGKDFESLSVHLGNNLFLMGDKPSEVDCIAFGMLSVLVHTKRNSPFHKMVTKTFPNLLDYVSRMKDLYYKDWDQLLEAA